ncbi:MAG TPA: Fe-S cluster assembly protein SufD [Oleiagrimonas sp.]|nr:Fe-S cluster assembly protein SufD [Oleiagrimonas sp.]
MSSAPFVQAIADRAPDLLSTLPGSGLSWLDRARRDQLQAFVRDGLPGARVEAWKYTALRALARREYALGDAQAGQRQVVADDVVLPGVDGARLVFVNGVFRADLSMLDDLPSGMRLQPLSQALENDAEPLRFFLARDRGGSDSDAFARLNAALAADGVVIRLDAGCRVETPVHVVYVGAPADDTLAWHARNIIELGEGASLSLVEHHAASGDQAHLGTLMADVVVRAGAELDWMQLQDAAADAVLMRRHAVRMDANANVKLHAVELGGKLVRHELDVELRGEGANLQTRGVFLPRKRQHLDTHLDIRHAACNTASHALWRGVADQRGRGVFHGQIIVDPGADGTDAALSNKNLLLSPHAEIDTQPVLEIYADEVMASHGATVGQLETNALFYLRSRGIPLEQARRLLTVAFCRAALEDVPNQALLAHFNTLLEAHLPVGGEAA